MKSTRKVRKSTVKEQKMGQSNNNFERQCFEGKLEVCDIDLEIAWIGKYCLNDKGLLSMH